MQPYTVALTSCGRFDLLKRTLESLLPRLEGPLAKVLVIEDSGDRGVYDVLRQFEGAGPDIEAILNDPPIGQIRSIDWLYARVETDWIFHCEDDWEFFGDGFIAASFAILQELPRCSMVNLRDPAEVGESDLFDPEAVTPSGARYSLVSMKNSWKFGGLHFNPGLRRMRDYRIVGPYADLGPKTNEARVSECYRDLGYRVAHLAPPVMRHIGDGRHVRDPVSSVSGFARLKRSATARLARLRWAIDPETDPVARARRRMDPP